MKKSILSSFVALMITSATYAQVQFDKSIQLTSTSAGQHSITGLELPVNSTDAANKAYVDAQIATVAAGGGSVPWSHFQAYTSTAGGQTFTVPSNVTLIKVQVWGGGGGGGGGYQDFTAGGGGGGGGGYAEGIFDVTANATYGVIVGTGGPGGNGRITSASVTNGTAGNPSSFGTLSATGGAGGQGGYDNAIAALGTKGGLGGVGSGGYINTTLGSGGFGATGGYFATSGTNGGGAISGHIYGGGSGGGIGGGNGAYGTANGSNKGGDAIPNTGAGGGGGGFSNSSIFGNGGRGADGQVIVFW